MVLAALELLNELSKHDSGHERAVVEDMMGHYEERLALIDCSEPASQIKKYQGCGNCRNNGMSSEWPQ